MISIYSGIYIVTAETVGTGAGASAWPTDLLCCATLAVIPFSLKEIARNCGSPNTVPKQNSHSANTIQEG
jgi:hypothetical protein